MADKPPKPGSYAALILRQIRSGRIGASELPIDPPPPHSDDGLARQLGADSRSEAERVAETLHRFQEHQSQQDPPRPKDGDRAAVRAKENPMANPFLNWTIFGTIKWSITILAVAVIVFVAGVIAESNVRHLLEDRGLDTVLTRTLDVMPAYLAYNATWLGIGLIFGAAAVLWLIWAFPHRLGDHHQLPKSRRIQWMTAIAAVAVIGGAFCLSFKQPQPFTIGVSPIEGAASAPVPPSRRITIEATPDFLMNLYSGKMSAEGDRIFAPYVGKWITVSGTVSNVTIGDSESQVLTFSLTKEGAYRSIVMYFDKNWNDRLSVLSRDQKISSHCEIRKANESYLYVGHCEFNEK